MGTVTELIERAAALLGSETKLAKAIGVSQNAVWATKRRNRISSRMAKAIHWATYNALSEDDFLQPDPWAKAVSGSELRPDLWTHPSHVAPLEIVEL